MSGAMTDDVPSIVRGLTEAVTVTRTLAPDPRMVELLRLAGPAWFTLYELIWPKRAQSFVMPARNLKSRGLLENELRDGKVFWRITPLGLRVRDALLSHEPERKS